jgi:hypothetical protein
VHDVVDRSASSTWATSRWAVGFKWVDEVGSPWPEELMAKYNLVPQGSRPR